MQTQMREAKRPSGCVGERTASSRSFPEWIRGAVLALLALALVFGGCSRKSAGDAKSGKPGPGVGAPVPVLVTQAVEKTMPVQIRAIGNVQPINTVAVKSRVNGHVTEVHFQEGQEVKRGDLLFTIDPWPLQAALEQARANLARDQAQLENAQVEFEREKRLFDAQLISQNEFDTARATLDMAKGTVLADQAAVTNAALNVEYSAIRSPIDGRTGNLLLRLGNNVKADDTTLLQINQLRPIYVAFAVPEQYLSRIRQRKREGTLKVGVSIPGETNASPRGELTFVDNAVDTTTGTIQLKATFLNTDEALWPGQFVDVALTLSEETNAVVVPSQAVQTGQNGEYIFVVKPDQTVELRPVTLGPALRGETAVQSGIKAGETVVTDGQLRLVPGSKVSIKPALAQARSGGAATNAPAGKP